MKNKSLKKSLIFALICFSGISQAENASSEEKDDIDKIIDVYTDPGFPEAPSETEMAVFYKSYGSIRHKENKGVGYDNGYTTIEAFYPFNPANTSKLYLSDLRIHFFNSGKYAGNFGFGYRSFDANSIFGLVGYYDFRKTAHHSYQQLSLCFEWLWTCFDLRLNGYLPVGSIKSSHRHFAFDKFKGNSIFITKKQEMALKGVQAELGYQLGRFHCVDFYVAGGIYDYMQDRKNIFGGKLRISANYQNRFHFEFSDSYDRTYHNIFQGLISYSIPLSLQEESKVFQVPCNLEGYFYEKLFKPVAREEIIAVANVTHLEKAINPETQEPYRVWFVNNTSHSLGTFESPFPTLAQAQSASAPGDVIYVYEGDSTTTGMDSGIVLQNNQFLLGASFAQPLPVNDGYFTIPAQSSLPPVITNNSGDVVSIANNNTVNGFYILNQHGHGISQANSGITVSNLYAQNNFFQGNGTYNAFELQNIGGLVQILNNKSTVQALGVHISNTNIQNGFYNIANNSYGQNAIAFQLSDCQNNTFIVNGNTPHLGMTSSPLVTILTSNSTAETPNSFFIQNNFSSADANPSVSYSGSNWSSSNLILYNNNFIAGDTNCIQLTLANQSLLYFNIANNSINGLSEGITVTAADNTILKGAIQNNTISSYYPLNASFTLSGNALFDCSIKNNRFTLNGISPATPEMQNMQVLCSNLAEAKLNIENNAFIGGNLTITTANNSLATASIQNNSFSQLGKYGIALTTNDSSKGIWNLEDNNIEQFSISAANIVSNSSSFTCLHFNNNTATPVETSPTQGAFEFDRNGSSVFNLSPMSGNVGIFTGNATTPNVTTCP